MNENAQYIRSDCIEGIRGAALELGYTPDVRTYLEGPYAPCYSTVLKHFGSWQGALDAANLGQPSRLRLEEAKSRRALRTKAERSRLHSKAVAAMQDQMATNIDVDRLAVSIDSTPAKLRRAFTEVGDGTIVETLTRLRVARAAALLETQKLTVSEVACRVGYSYSGLIRVFTKGTGESPSHYQRRLRMEHAARLLVEHPKLSAREVAGITGPVGGRDFNKVFRRFFGMSPLAYRKMLSQQREQDLTRSRITRDDTLIRASGSS